MRVRPPSGDQTAIITSWPCIGPGGGEATRLLLVTYDQVSGGGRASTPEQAKARTLAIVAAEGAERRKLHSLGYRLADIPKRPNKLFR